MSSELKEKPKYKAVVVIIRMINAKTDEVETTKIKAIDSRERREWLKDQVAKDVAWAILNGRYVEVINQEDDKP